MAHRRLGMHFLSLFCFPHVETTFTLALGRNLSKGMIVSFNALS